MNVARALQPVGDRAEDTQADALGLRLAHQAQRLLDELEVQVGRFHVAAIPRRPTPDLTET
ncbi:MAG: hypothetical protein ACRD3A_05990, partial [Terriglobales bacterium]